MFEITYNDADALERYEEEKRAALRTALFCTGETGMILEIACMVLKYNL